MDLNKAERLRVVIRAYRQDRHALLSGERGRSQGLYARGLEGDRGQFEFLSSDDSLLP